MIRVALVSIAFLRLVSAVVVRADAPASPYSKWTQGPPADPNYFPLTVWLQQARKAAQFEQMGINTYVAVDGGATDENLAALKAAHMKLICDQDEKSLKHVSDPTIIGWMHGDEPDNAQSIPGGKGYGPPVTPQKIIDEYNTMVKADPTRPVMLNLDLAVAYNEWPGRGSRTGHAEDYPEYIKGADIVSFDIYPVAGGIKQVQGKLEYCAKGVDHLVKLGQSQKVIWNCIETSHIGDAQRIATPKQVRVETWDSIIHGSMGIIYFLHQFKPTFNDSAILDDPEMLAAVTALNKQITSLAPVLNSPTVTQDNLVKADNDAAPVDVMLKRVGDSTYLFAAQIRDASANATFTLPNLPAGAKLTVVDENRTIDLKNGAFTDAFAPYDVHIYKIGN